MNREEAINQLKDFIILHREQHGWDVKTIKALEMAIKALEQINKIVDIVDGTIDHFEYDDAMDMLYEIKGVIK